MFILFGFGHRTVKDYGVHGEIMCRRCNNEKQWQYKQMTTWFTLFFIPVIPYSRAYVRVCPICGELDKLTKEDFMGIVEGHPTQDIQKNLVEEDHRYEGKTETQANYMREMAAFKSEQKQTSDNEI